MTDNELLLALSSMIDEKLKPFEHKLKEIKTDIHEIQLTLENDTNKRISIIAEGHLDLIRKLDDALKVENEKELLLLRVATLESEIKKIKKKIEQSQDYELRGLKQFVENGGGVVNQFGELDDGSEDDLPF